MIIIYYTPCHGCPHFEECHKIPHDEEGKEEENEIPTFPDEDLPEVDIQTPPPTPGREEEERPRLSP